MDFIEYAYDFNGIISIGAVKDGETIRIPYPSKEYTFFVIERNVPINHTVFIDKESEDSYLFRIYGPDSPKDKTPDLSFTLNLVWDEEFTS